MSESLNKIASLNGIEVFHIKCDKFKTNTINIFFKDNLKKESATLNALLPAVLKRGCESYPTFSEISLYLEELYGAAFDYGVSKKGEMHVIQFYMEHVCEKYVGRDSNLFSKSLNLILDIITKPLLVNGCFNESYVEQEKKNLKEQIESRINDKIVYSIERCMEEVCEGEDFAVYEQGALEILEKIDSKILFEHYKRFILNLPIVVFVTGQLEKSDFDILLKRLGELRRENIKEITSGFTSEKPEAVKFSNEKMEVSQGKLCLGFRTNIDPSSKDYYKLLVYNGILGGGMHSKLFQNVREKASLAYYASSRLEKFKGLMVIACGIEIQNKDKTKEIIQLQLEDIKKGNISDSEINSTIKTIKTGIEAMSDGQLQMVDFFFNQTVSGSSDTFETIIENIEKVTKNDVVVLAENILLDTVYFLGNV